MNPHHEEHESAEHETLYGELPENIIGVDGDDPYKFYAYRPNELLVAKDVDDTVREELDRRVGPVRRTVGVGTMVKYGLPAPYPAAESLADLRSLLPDSCRSSISLNTVLSLGWHCRLCCPNPPQPVAKPELPKLDDPKAGSGVRVAIIDTGVAELEQEFESHVRRIDRDGDGIDVHDEDPCSTRLDHGGGHGTFAAGLILQVAPEATVVSLRRVGTFGVIDDWALAEALVELSTLDGADKIDIVSLSLGGHTPNDMGLSATAEALRVLFAAHPETIVVAAAGNDEVDRPFFPAAFKQVIAVGAVDRDGKKAWYSNYGWWVDACAPGIDVISTFLNKKHFSGRSLTIPRLPDADPFSFEGWASWSGSSFTAPQVAGAFAARLSATHGGVTSRQPLSFLTPVPELGALFLTRVKQKDKPHFGAAATSA